MATATARKAQHAAPQSQQKAVATTPFPLASRKMTRLSFQESQVLNAAAPTPMTPIQIPAVGYLSRLKILVNVTASAADANIVKTADAPWNLFSSVEFRTAAGNDIIPPLDGFSWYVGNKYFGLTKFGQFSDPKANPAFVPITVPTGAGQTVAQFVLDIPFEIDKANGYGSIPALASNRSYQLNFVLAALGTWITAATATYTVNITGVAEYWSEPPAQSANGAPQATAPSGVGTVAPWYNEPGVPVTPGDRLVKSNNVGNVIRTLAFILRKADGTRTDADFPPVSELYLDNEPMFYLPQALWLEKMGAQFGIASPTKDTLGGLDTGVYVIAFEDLTGSLSGDPANSRNQLLPTLDASQLQIRGTFGANASGLQILTSTIIPTDAATLYAR